uniref:Uncharacterized protein AlNc14C305G10436 n=1 Tax=Albugo laibachii Nc14 TaxID=890382 RepID=F0WVX5_9STRA|nr:conserved hypothetical protein [Albugo laibachii Nc14]|eukprot:CCA25576.1 conserved hypothetical protein [Albugo laibachii Nc14]
MDQRVANEFKRLGIIHEMKLTHSSKSQSTSTPTEALPNEGTPPWPVEVDLSGWYSTQREGVDNLLDEVNDLSYWKFERFKDETTCYVHYQNNERLTYAARAITTVQGTISSVLECLRSYENEKYRIFLQSMYSKNYLDAQVVYKHATTESLGPIASKLSQESIALKWLALSSGKRLSRGKEMLVREYCALYQDHPRYGPVGICRFESYDGPGAKYGFRCKPDTYNLTVFEPSSYIIRHAPQEGSVQVILTLAVRTAHGEDNVSSGVKLLATRMAHNLSHLKHTMQQIILQPGLMVNNVVWVKDGDRSTCTTCQQSFSMLRRRHHCRFCGEVVCGSCTEYKYVCQTKVRICTTCLRNSLKASSNQDACGVLEDPRTMTSLVDKHCHSCSSNEDDNDGDCVDREFPSKTSKSNEMESSKVGALNSFLQQKSLKHSYSSIRTTASSEQSTYGSDWELVAALASPSRKTEQTPESGLFGASSQFSSTCTNIDKKPPVSSDMTQPQILHYLNEDFDQICMLAMETINCPIAGIRTRDFELVKYHDGAIRPSTRLPRSLPTFRRLAQRGKPCIVLNAANDPRIFEKKRISAKLQFFIGIPLVVKGHIIGDLCVGDINARQSLEQHQIDVLVVLGETVARYMGSEEFQSQLDVIKTQRRSTTSTTLVASRMGSQLSSRFIPETDRMLYSTISVKEVAF